MSGEMTVRTAVVAALRADVALMDRLNALFDGTPVRATPPYAAVGEETCSEWGAKGLDGVELRIGVSLHDAGDTPTALAPMLARIGAVMSALGAAGDGWRVVTARLMRSRVAKAGRGQPGWQAVVEYRVRAVCEG
ncbi:MAG: DUF3168 domain-containing protein [Sphingobium sp.]